MKILLSSMLFLIIYTNSTAQVGVLGQYHSQSAPLYYINNDKTNDDNITFTGGGIDYSFRLKNYRVEFFPALVYLIGKSSYTNQTTETTHNLDLTTLGLQFNTHFYLFDIEGDCHCPVWSKDGDLLKKGFYLSLSLNAYNTKFKETNTADQNITYGAIALGAGSDIGLSKNLTLTPSIQYELQQRKLITNDFLVNDNKQNSVSNLIIGLRLGYSFKDH